jgi:hypothetical protein
MQICFVILLYLLGAVLPIVGIVRAIFHVSGPARQFRHRQPHIQAIRQEAYQRRSAATTERQRQEADEWLQEELEKKDKWGKPYGRDDWGFRTTSSGAEALTQFKRLSWDAVWVGGGLIAGTSASIWSLWL